jgi:hypothetical protein
MNDKDSKLLWEAYDTIENVPYVVLAAGSKGKGVFATRKSCNLDIGF